MKVIVLKEGVHTKVDSQEGYLNGIGEICSTVTLIKAEKEGEKNILVDTGYFGFEEEILSRLDKEGLKPEDIEYVINTHEHFDHCANNYLFTNAKKLISILEWSPKTSLNVYGDVKDIHIQDGVGIIYTPGHKEPHCSVVVKTDEKTYVIAGDTISKDFYLALYEKHDKVKSALRIMDMADVIIPGHGEIIEKKDFPELRKKVKHAGRLAF